MAQTSKDLHQAVSLLKESHWTKTFFFFSIQFSSVVQSFVTLCDPMDCSSQVSLSITNSWSLLKFMSIELVIPSNHLILCRLLLLLPSIFPIFRVFSSELALAFRIKQPKYWSFSFSTSPSTEYSGLISFRIDWFGLPAVQRTLKSLFQHHNSSTQQHQFFRHSAFFNVQLSYLYMTTGKTITLTMWNLLIK